MATAVPISPTPVTDAVREDRLVWLGGQDEMVRRYPGSPRSCRTRSRWPRCP
ncbi:hypothetical protein ACR6C2_44210 [Streptomyces sp. INA 01156]